jgi:hypothetical protein
MISVTNDDNSENLPAWAGGQGGPPDRTSLAMIRQAVSNNWDIPDAWKAALPAMCAKIASDESKGDRERLRAIEILRAMQRDNLDAAQVLDRVERLDEGRATDRIELGPIKWNPRD